MKEYKIITLTPTTSHTVKSMEGYVKSCETDLNKLAKEGWKLVCTESIAQQENSNLILFMERDSSEGLSQITEERHQLPEEIISSVEAYVEHPNASTLSEN